jgi:guanylate kinase
MSQRTSQAFLTVISGPSGVGKTTLVERVLPGDPLLCESISTTTRAPREGEKAGEDYFFVTREVFEAMKERELVEWAEVHGELYGTPRRFVEQELEAGRDVMLNIDIQGGNSVKKVFPDALMIFILPPSFETLEERVRDRGTIDPGELDRRIANARKEITASKYYSYIVVNDDLDNAVAQVAAIIVAERCRWERQKPEVVERLEDPQ